MEPAATLALINGVVIVLGTIIRRQFNTWFGGKADVKDKNRWLQISIVNLSTEHTLMVEDTWFDSGRCWSQPFGAVAPGSATTFFVCERDGTMFTGVSGGVGLRAYKKNHSVFEDAEGSWWICTFSNPFVGATKCLTRWKGYGIKPLWKSMKGTSMIRDKRCGCYMKEDRNLVFIWKNPDSPWKNPDSPWA